MANITCAEVYQVPKMKYLFDFTIIYEIAKKINETCPTDPRLFKSFTLLLKNEFVHNITGAGGGLARHDWTAYPSSETLQRFMAWKAPLIQVIFQFPRPPFGFTVEAFTILHLLGDPIDTIASMLFTLSLCQERAKLLRHRPDNERKGLTLIMMSYDECGDHREAATLEKNSMGEGVKFDSNYQIAADSLAADRATSFLPVITAELIFMASYAISFMRAFKSPFSPKTPWHLEIHGIGFSFTYLWAIPVVLLGAFIGVTQSELAVPRILRQFEAHANLHAHPQACPTMSVMAPDGIVQKPDLEKRLEHGAIPSWRPDKWSRYPDQFSRARANAIRRSGRLCILAIIITLLGTVGGIVLSARIPPDGFSCRPIAEGTIFLCFLVSFMFQYALAKLNLSTITQFRIVLVKDIISAGIFVAAILTIQSGILNRSDCWSLWGKMGVCLPQITKEIVEHRLRLEYPLVVFLTISMLMSICAVVGWTYQLALRVYLQRDDGRSRGRAIWTAAVAVKSTVKRMNLWIKQVSRRFA